MDINERLNTFILLGKFLVNYSPANYAQWDSKLTELIENDNIYNPWFTKENIIQSIKAIGESLSEDKIKLWIKKYPNLQQKTNTKRIGVVTAGNIPLVGFHDFLCVLVSGNVFIGKLSSKDNRLLKFIADFIIQVNNKFEDLIFFTEDKLDKFDAIIATGSNNTARYFEYYFGKYPHIIRKNRNSIAVLNGNESNEDIENLGNDIFSYFGLGCRNVSKIFVPEDYCFDHFFEHIEKYNSIYQHNKYANNYDYNKSIYLMNRIQHLDNGFLIVKEDAGISSPIGVVFFEYYKNIEQVKQYILINQEQIQCVVSIENLTEGVIPFGKAQQPELWDYADNIDTMDFLTRLH